MPSQGRIIAAPDDNDDVDNLSSHGRSSSWFPDAWKRRKQPTLLAKAQVRSS